jgi:hypothetical protein
MIYKKIQYIIFLATIAIALLIYKGSIDDFIPSHIAIINEISCKGFLPDYARDVIPGFYIIGAIIIILTGLPSIHLMFYPIQLFPYVLVMVCFLYKFSKNYLLSLLIVFSYFISGTIGTSKVFFWPHALGEIIFFSICILFLKIIENKSVVGPAYRLAMIIGGLSLIYISYNLTLMYILLLFTSFILLIILYYFNFNINYSLIRSTFIYLLLIIIMELGLSEFFYKGFIPTIKAVQTLEISGIDKFLLSYFSISVPETFLSDIYLIYPKTISIISATKYIFLLFSIIIFLIYSYKNKSHKTYDKYDLMIISFILFNLLFAILRLYIGGIVITAIYMPAILSICRLHYLGKMYKSWAISITIILLLTTPLYYHELSSANLINRIDDYEYLEESAFWYMNNSGNDDAISDELTKNFFIFFSLERFGDRIDNEINFAYIEKKITIFYLDDIKNLLQISSDICQKKYFFINYKLNSISLENWISVRSWKASKYKIENNINLNKIYDISYLSVYF